MYPKNKNLSKESLLFVVTILEFEARGRYSYGRKKRRDTIMNVRIKLPVDKNNNPDWKFMEDYIRSLRYKKLTTKTKKQKTKELEIQKWKEFRIGDLFSIELSKGDIKLDDINSGDIPLVSSGETDNGIVGYIDKHGDGIAKIFPANRLTVDMFGNSFYQDTPFYAVSHGRVNILNPKFEMTKAIGLFLSSVINQERFKYSYGRAVYSNVIADMIIKLPIDHEDNPDWHFRYSLGFYALWRAEGLPLIGRVSAVVRVLYFPAF